MNIHFFKLTYVILGYLFFIKGTQSLDVTYI